MIKRKFWKTGVAIAVVLLMQTDVAVYAVNTDGEVQVTQESNITQDGNAVAVIEGKNLETADAEADSTETDSAEENVTEDVLTVEYDAETPAPAAEEKQVGCRLEKRIIIWMTMIRSIREEWHAMRRKQSMDIIISLIQVEQCRLDG